MTNKPISEVIQFPKSRDWSMEKIQEHISRCDMAASVTMPAEGYQDLLFQTARQMERIAALEQQNAELSRWREEYQAKLNAEHVRVGAQYQSRITELEQQLAAERARVVKLPLKSDAADFMHNAPVYSAEDVEQALRSAGIEVKE
ncbi:hypothetical protein GMW39_00720 [Pectobacterium parmentieri]|uniref:keratin n=1 Tax=Pectobacterium parmentieri TaxID=1905730 RepID=UPI001373C90C|nr:keratin [Pectobacterium parmentieri]QHQ14531.1 hypothetical protein GMW39_00720 [Pectobacterium parmentieri]